jgi:hypothetical protein
MRSAIAAFLEDALFSKEVVEGRANSAFLFGRHHRTSFIRLRASFKSWAGVFCVFLMIA